VGILLQVAHCPSASWASSESGGDAEIGGRGQGRRDAARSSSKFALNCKSRILIVDDDEAVRETLAELLEDVGFCSVQAANAAEALTVLRREQSIDALVTDLTMPGDDGIALIRQAREINGLLPAILLTGYAEQVTSISTIAGGNFHVLRKPVESDRLIEQLQLLVGRPGPN
jgi:CheY-like chemotaxis protein